MIASGYLFLIQNGKILLLRRHNTGYEDGNYGLPAGHVEDNETITDATVREVFEEVGLDINSSDLQLVHVMHRKESDIRMDFFFTVKDWEGKPKNMEPEKCDDMDWFPIKNLPENTIGYIRDAITHYFNSTCYSEVGFLS